MVRTLLLVCLVGVFLAPVANAGTVRLDLNPSLQGDRAATLVSAEWQDPWGDHASGVIAEQGFHIGFTVAGEIQDLEDAASLAFGRPILADCDDCGDGTRNVTELTFTRPDGAPFALSYLDAIRTDIISGFVAVDFERADDYELLSYLWEPLLNNVLLQGVTAEGKQVVHMMSSYADQSCGSCWMNPFTGYGPTTLAPDPAAGLTDLVSLTLSIYSTDSVFEHFDFLRQKGELPGELQGFTEEACWYAISYSETQCVVEGLGTLNWFVRTDNNYFTSVIFDSFGFEVADAPAPVPLPASGLLVLAALGGLGVAAGRRRVRV